MKRCPRCSEHKPIEAFNFKNKARGIRASWCKTCTKAASRRNYEANTILVKSKSALYSKAHAAKIRALIWEYLETHPCISCGESDPIVLEFDHREQSEKSFGIGQVINRGYSWNRIQKEIDKCDVRCANCHRRRTAIQLGWAKAFNLTNSDAVL